MKKFISVFVGLIFIGNFVVGSIAFIYFLNWYDTGQVNSDGWQFVAVGGFLFGCLALLVENLLYNRYMFWPKSQFLFFLRSVIFSTLGISLAIGAGAAVSLALDEVSEGGESMTIIPIILIAFVVMLFYGVMVIPFGTIVGVVNGIIFRKSRNL